MLSFIYKFHFILYKFIQSFGEIKRERDWDSERELERKTLRECRTAGGSHEADKHRSPAQRQRRRRQSDEPMTDLPSTMSMSICEKMSICDEGWPLRRRRRARCGDDVIVHGLLGLVLVCVLGIFFFFLINTSVLCVWFVEFCVWFAFVLGFDLSASDDATWWDFAKHQRRDGFNFSFSVFFFFFGWESVGLPWASYL